MRDVEGAVSEYFPIPEPEEGVHSCLLDGKSPFRQSFASQSTHVRRLDPLLELRNVENRSYNGDSSTELNDQVVPNNQASSILSEVDQIYSVKHLRYPFQSLLRIVATKDCQVVSKDSSHLMNRND